MDYTNNYAQIGGYGMSMTPPQLFYPEMNGSQGYEQGSAMDILKPRYDSYYKDDYKQNEERVRGVRNNYYDGGDYKHGQKGEAIDLNHFYDGGDFKHPQENRRDSHNVDYGSQHYVANSASGYRSYARQTRRDREMLARNGLYSPRDGCSRRNEYPSYNDDTGHSSSRNSYWQPLATVMSGQVGTAGYMAPEVCRGESYTEKCDVYSFGIVCWEIMSQKKPFYHVQNRNFLAIFNLSVDKNERPPIDDVQVIDEKTKNMKILIQECWDKDATVRPTMKELVIRLGEDCKHNGSEDIDRNTRRVVGTTRLPPSPRPPFVMILILILMELKALKPN
ncbi:hypothetical protein ACLKA7_004375 [Drosophila subpalustris]